MIGLLTAGRTVQTDNHSKSANLAKDRAFMPVKEHALSGIVPETHETAGGEGGSTMHGISLGIDVAKQVFYLRDGDVRGQIVRQQRVSRSK